MSDPAALARSERALVLAPLGRDAVVASAILGEAGVAVGICGDLASLCREIDRGAGLVVVVEEAVQTEGLSDCARWVAAQPPWSDLPFIVLTGRGGGLERNPIALRLVDVLGNVTLLERPFHPTTLVSVVRTALASRRRQYHTRAHLFEQAAAAERLRQSEERLRFALAAGHLGSWELEPSSGALSTSEHYRAIFGRKADEDFTYPELLASIHEQDRPGMEAAVARTIADGGDYNAEYRIRRPDGSLHWVQARGQVSCDDHGRVLRVAGVSQDITARKLVEEELAAHRERLEELIQQRTAALEEANRQLIREAAERQRAEARLRQSQKMEVLGQLTGGIAHDFNNLLTAVLGNLELLLGRTRDPNLERIATNALAAANRGAKLTAQLLAFSRTQRLTLAPVDVNPLVTGMNDLLARSLGPAIQIRIALAPEVALAQADANQLELAILNLAINARDAMPDGGVLTIATEMMPNRVAISVADTGIGMPPEIAERAFEPFFTTKEIGKGTGLGLSQVYGIAMQSGGEVRIDSQPGHGTTVRILLPTIEQEAGVTSIDGEPEVVTGDRETILVVDDDADVRRFLVESLDALGYRVAEAADGREGLEALEQTAPDLMIIDYAMPGLSGAELATEALRRHPGQPIVLATGHADTTALTGELGKLPVLRKPFRIGELATVVSRTLVSVSANDLLAPRRQKSGSAGRT